MNTLAADQPWVDLGTFTRAKNCQLNLLLNAYGRDCSPPRFRDHVFVHDPGLKVLGLCWPGLWARFRLPAIGLELHCPVQRRCSSGRHSFFSPIFVRQPDQGEPRSIDLAMLANLIADEFAAQEPLSLFARARWHGRLTESRRVLAKCLAAHVMPAPPNTLPTFLRGEQGILFGHPFHPFAKSRHGWSDDEICCYSPEFAQPFQLTYLLVDPELVVAQGQVLEPLWLALRQSVANQSSQAQVLSEHSQWLVVPFHPAQYRMHVQRGDVARLLATGRACELGPGGAMTHATSSIRTVTVDDVAAMLKFSLEVEITNAKRINHRHELQKGVMMARLLDTDWGKQLAQAIPKLTIVRDPSWFVVNFNGFDHLPVGVREHPYRPGSSLPRRVVVLAYLCEPSPDDSASGPLVASFVTMRSPGGCRPTRLLCRGSTIISLVSVRPSSQRSCVSISCSKRMHKTY